MSESKNNSNVANLSNEELMKQMAEALDNMMNKEKQMEEEIKRLKALNESNKDLEEPVTGLPKEKKELTALGVLSISLRAFFFLLFGGVALYFLMYILYICWELSAWFFATMMACITLGVAVVGFEAGRSYELNIPKLPGMWEWAKKQVTGFEKK